MPSVVIYELSPGTDSTNEEGLKRLLEGTKACSISEDYSTVSPDGESLKTIHAEIPDDQVRVFETAMKVNPFVNTTFGYKWVSLGSPLQNAGDEDPDGSRSGTKKNPWYVRYWWALALAGAGGLGITFWWLRD